MADTPVEKATVGRIVHYVPDGSKEHIAALVTRVELGVGIDLTVFDSDSMFRAFSILHDANFGPGTWHWAERD
jgi:hypothetical protein